MDFYRLSGQYQVYFSHRGGFTKLQAALGYDPVRNRIGEGYLIEEEQA